MTAQEQLDELKISYQQQTHELHTISAIDTAASLNLPLGSLIKTLILQGRKIGFIVVLVPGDCWLDLPGLRQELADGSLHLASHAAALEQSGYPIGQVTALGLRCPLPVYACAKLQQLTLVSISSGYMYSHLILQSKDLLRATQAILLKTPSKGLV
jgi:prolyl-tRNA editing enzyme YbaK/EbsC (Cys-tRNA(Pro) deacylase)